VSAQDFTDLTVDAAFEGAGGARVAVLEVGEQDVVARAWDFTIAEACTPVG
jgi:hypothetical protein